MKSNNPKLWWQERHYLPSNEDLIRFYDFTQRRRGWVYLIFSPEYPEWGVKVGRTKRNPNRRALQLAHEGSLHRYTVIHAFYALNAAWAENRVHQLLSAYRIQKEWFICDSTTAILAMECVEKKEAELIHPFFDPQALLQSSVAVFVNHGFNLEYYIELN